MKHLLTTQIILWLMLACSINLAAQSADWYLQVGGGYLLMDRIEQLGFDKQGPSAMAYAEIGRKNRPISVGIQSNFLSDYSFYRFSMEQQVRTVYAKYSFNSLIDWMPYGLDPYVMVGASHSSTRFTSYDKAGAADRTVEEVQIQEKPGYSVGGGVQVGNHHLILGLQYQYTPNKNSFEVPPEFQNLPFATSSHFVQMSVGLRLTAPKIKGNRKCPSFGRKGSLRF